MNVRSDILSKRQRADPININDCINQQTINNTVNRKEISR